MARNCSLELISASRTVRVWPVFGSICVNMNKSPSTMVSGRGLSTMFAQTGLSRTRWVAASAVTLRLTLQKRTFVARDRTSNASAMAAVHIQGPLPPDAGVAAPLDKDPLPGGAIPVAGVVAAAGWSAASAPCR